MSEEPLYSVRTAAKLLGMSEYMVRHWTRKGELHHVRVDGGPAILFERQELDRFGEMISGLTVHEVAAMLGLTGDAVRAYSYRGQLAARKALGELRFDHTEVLRFAAEHGFVVRELVVAKVA